MNRPLPATLPTFAALVLVVVAACGGAGATPGTGATTGPGATTLSGTGSAATGAAASQAAVIGTAACELLTDDEIKTVTGYAVASKAPSVSIAYENNCLWKFADVAWEISLGVESSARSAANFDRLAQGGGGSVPIPGVGDRAVRLDASGSPIALAGDTLIDLLFTGAGRPKDSDVELLKKIIEKVR